MRRRACRSKKNEQGVIMRIAVDRGSLLRSLGRVHRIVERRNTIPILSNVLIEAREQPGGICLKSTDLDLEVLEETEARVEQPGAATVPAHLLYDIVRKLPDGSEVALALSEDGKFVSVVAGRSQFQLESLPRDDFPELSADGFTHNFELSANQLKYLIDSTQFAVSTEETRYYLNGIYFHVPEAEEGAAAVLRAVATDGHRLASAELEAPESAVGMPGIIIPRKTVSELQKLLGEMGEAKVSVELSDAKIRLKMEAVVLTSKLIDGVFPDYQRVIPRNNSKKLEVKRADFIASVDRVSTISTDRSRAVKLSLETDNVVLTVNNPDSGSAEDKVAAVYEAEPMEIGFNYRYLLDIANQLNGEAVSFMLADSGAPTLIRDEADKNRLYVLMPMRV